MDVTTLVFTIILIVIALWIGWLIVGPRYRVWAQRKRGEADYAQAEAETRIAVLKAHAELDAAKHYAEADVERARGIAKAIREVEVSLGGPEGYLRWKYIHMLEQQIGVKQIIYVPTEAGLPILEAGRRDLEPDPVKAPDRLKG